MRSADPAIARFLSLCQLIRKAIAGSAEHSLLNHGLFGFIAQ